MAQAKKMQPAKQNSIPNIDYCGVVNLLRCLIEKEICTEKEAKRIAARVAKNIGADVILSP